MVQRTAETQKVNQRHVHLHPKKMGYLKKLDIWIPYEFKHIHFTVDIEICNMLLKCQENNPFLTRTVMRSRSFRRMCKANGPGPKVKIHFNEFKSRTLSKEDYALSELGLEQCGRNRNTLNASLQQFPEFVNHNNHRTNQNIYH